MVKQITKSKLISKIKNNKKLSTVIAHSESIKDLVQVCADDLSVVNTVLKEELSVQSSKPSFKNAVKKNTTVENKVQLAVDQLEVVNNALKDEVKERENIEKELEVVIIEKDIATEASLHDLLTGLPNRALFYDRLEHGLEQAKRHGWNLAVMFLDLDNFKQINDKLGHDVGDKVLLTVAKRLKENTRNDDSICRLGGDEFAVLVLEASSRHQEAIFRRLEKSLRELNEDEFRYQLSLSVGVARFDPKRCVSLGELMAQADQAMYEEKRRRPRI